MAAPPVRRTRSSNRRPFALNRPRSARESVLAQGSALSAFSDQFDPVAFFKERTVGQAVVRIPLGALICRCHIETSGKPANDYDAMHFDERYTLMMARPRTL